jgi:hypothetical protein
VKSPKTVYNKPVMPSIRLFFAAERLSMNSGDIDDGNRRGFGYAQVAMTPRGLYRGCHTLVDGWGQRGWFGEKLTKAGLSPIDPLTAHRPTVDKSTAGGVR